MSHSYDYNKKYVPLAKELRRHMTKEERKLWYLCLSLLPVRAHRQKNIGNYIVDFYIPKNKIVIEVDGSQHNEMEQYTKDVVRDCYLREHGITVLRYTNIEVYNRFSYVVHNILQHLELDNEETLVFMRKTYRKRKGNKDE